MLSIKRCLAHLQRLARLTCSCVPMNDPALAKPLYADTARDRPVQIFLLRGLSAYFK